LGCKTPAVGTRSEGKRRKRKVGKKTREPRQMPEKKATWENQRAGVVKGPCRHATTREKKKERGETNSAIDIATTEERKKKGGKAALNRGAMSIGTGGSTGPPRPGQGVEKRPRKGH